MNPSRLARLTTALAGLSLAACAGGDLTGSHSEIDFDELYSRSTSITPADAVPMAWRGDNGCPADHVRTTDQDGSAYCVHRDFCAERVGDFCALAPRDADDGTPSVNLYSNEIFWCYARGTLVESGGAARIEQGDEIIEPPADTPLLRSSDHGCVVNPDGHGLRISDRCRSESMGEDEAFATCHPATDLHPESAVICRETEVFDHRGFIEVGEEPLHETEVFEAASREYCEDGCADGACQTLPTIAAVDAGESCPTGYEPANVVRDPNADAASNDVPCLREGACDGRVGQFCGGAPVGVAAATQWARLDIPEGMPVVAGAHLYTCPSPGAADPSATIYECPSLDAVAGSCLVNDLGSACRDQTAAAEHGDVEPAESSVVRVGGVSYRGYRECSRRFPGREIVSVWTWIYDAASGGTTQRLEVLSSRLDEDCP